MKTEQEIEEKIKELKEERDKWDNSDYRYELAKEISLLLWVLD